MLTDTLKHIMSRCAQKPVITAVVSSLLAVMATAFAATHFDMTTDTGELISAKTEWRQNEAILSKAFKQAAGDIIVVVDGKTPELASDGAARLVGEMLADRKHFVTAKLADGGDFFKQHGLLFASLGDVREQTAGLVKAQPLLGGLAHDPSLHGIAQTLALVASADKGDVAGLDELEPALRQMNTAIDSTLAGRPSWFSWQQQFSSGKGDLAPPTRQIVLVQPELDFDSLQPGDDAADAVRADAAKLGLDAAHGLSIGITGEVPLSDEEFGSLEENIGFVGLVMFGALLIALWFATKSLKTVLAIIITILIGLVVTMAIGLFAVKTLNLISVAFIPLFVGLGVDFGIQVSVRFNAERRAGSTPLAALEHCAEQIGEPLLLAAAAIFLGFGAFLPTDYVGIAQLGIISGIGMVVALALNVTLLPALLVLLRPPVPSGEVGYSAAAPIDRWLDVNHRKVLIAFGLSMVASIALLPLVVFDFNPLHLRDPEAPAMRMLNELMRDAQRTPNTISVLTPNIDAANAMAKRLSALPEVEQAITADSLVPSDQPAKLALIEDAALLLDPAINPFELSQPPDDAAAVAVLGEASAKLSVLAEQTSGPLRDAAGKLGSNFARLATAPPAMRQKVEAVLVQPLNITLDSVRFSLQAGAITRETLPPDVAGGWIAEDGRALVQVFPKGDSNDNHVLSAFTAAVRKVAPNATGLPVDTQEAAHTVARAFIKAGILALLAVSLLLYAVLRSLREVAFTLAPVVLSGFLTLSTCVLIGQSLNFANIIAFPLLFGVGVAFHIYFVMAWRKGTHDLLQTPLTRAVVFSALATGSAFGALWLSHHPGTASMGLILMLSLVWTLVCALIFEPALLDTAEHIDNPRKQARATA